MRAHWLIVDHPYATVTDSDGHFEIPDLPPGEVSLSIWHERAGYLEKALKLEVPAGKVREVLPLHYKLEQFESKRAPASSMND